MGKSKLKPVILLIFDGFGVAPAGKGNAVTLAKHPVLDSFIIRYPVTTLQASGEAVGLSWGEFGNSEVCHLNLGAGHIVYQTLPKINKSIDDGSFVENEKFIAAIKYVKKNKSRLHLMGLVSNGGVHSHQDHLYALLKFCKTQGVGEVFIHAFLDGRDTKKDGAVDFIKQLQTQIKTIGVGQIASLSGRFYGMDRDNHWDREEKAYRAIAEGISENKGDDPIELIEKSYQNDIFDEEFVPAVITKGGKPVVTVQDKDAVIFFNFRADRARQMATIFTVPGFDKFKRDYLKNLFFVTFTEYEKNLPVEVAYPPEKISLPLAKIFEEKNLWQLHAAETEKYAHVTFFFNGGKEDPYRQEDRILVPSPAVSSYAQKPEMSVYELTDRIIKALDEDKYDFIVINFANPDMVGHTGVVDAAVKAIQACDECLGKIAKVVLQKNGAIL